jgi:hypothetical protein
LKIQAPNPGPSEAKPAEDFTISATGLRVTDGNAQVAGGPFTWPFKVAVLEDSITLNPADVYATVGTPVPLNTKVIANFNSSVATIALGNASNSFEQAVSWNGLTLSSDIRGQIDIAGTPGSSGSQKFRVFAKGNVNASVVIASADFTVHVSAAGGFYLDPNTVDFTVDEYDQKTANVITSETLADLKISRQYVDSLFIDWNGLRVRADLANKQVTVEGIPNAVDEESFTVKGTSDKGELLTATLTVRVRPATDYSLSLSPSATLHPIAEKEFEMDTMVTVSPALDLTSITVDGQTALNWNGLTIVVDSAAKNIKVFGIPESQASRSFEVAATAARPVSPARLTITVHPPEQEGRMRGRFIDLATEEIEVERGKSTSIEVKCLSYITLDSVTEVNPDGKWQWIQGPTAEGVKEFYVSVRPTITGLYTLRVNYDLGGTAYYENVSYRSVRTDEKDLGSSGCALGAGSMTGLALAVLCLGVIRRKS